MKKKIYLGADHAGFELKEHVKQFLLKGGHEVQDLGAHEYDQDDDYPDFIIPCAKEVAKNNARGIIFGGSGQGEAIAANKIKGIRAALYYGCNEDIIKLSKTHNDANMLSIGARFVSKDDAVNAVKLWLSISFDNEDRHSRRIFKIKKFEQ